jgi:methionyl-tRNA formyltransferase
MVMSDEKSIPRYVIASNKSWSRRIFEEVISRYPGRWDLIDSPDILNLEYLQSLDPIFVFFLHWSEKVSEDIIDNFECIGFHMTDVPYGRGGSPLQNLILRGHRKTNLSAIRMTRDFDSGPVYLKKELCLEGNAEEIYIRATYLAADMIKYIIFERPNPNPQEGEIVLFKRRRPEESEIPMTGSLLELYDFIRMLDAEGYPNAFIDYDGFRYEIRRAALYDGRIIADVKITKLED